MTSFVSWLPTWVVRGGRLGCLFPSSSPQGLLWLAMSSKESLQLLSGACICLQVAVTSLDFPCATPGFCGTLYGPLSLSCPFISQPFIRFNQMAQPGMLLALAGPLTATALRCPELGSNSDWVTALAESFHLFEPLGFLFCRL